MCFIPNVYYKLHHNIVDTKVSLTSKSFEGHLWKILCGSKKHGVCV